MKENMKTKTNGLKGSLCIYDPSCLSVVDAWDNYREHKLSEIKIISCSVDPWGKDYVHYVNPDTDKGAFSIVLHGLREDMVLLSNGKKEESRCYDLEVL